MCGPMSLLALVMAVLMPGENGAPAEAYQFDFWLGEWQVNNRSLNPDASWSDSGQARARITPLFERRLVIEQWDGHKDGNQVFGFSARAFDPARGKWRLLLNWPGGGVPSFGILEGRFRHGRGEFLAGSPARLTRYTFSDTLPHSLRWDASYSNDQGKNWHTNWIMEFSRTGPADEMTEERLFTRLDPDTRCARPEARGFDFLHGEWEVVREELDADGEVTAEVEFLLRAAPLISACAVIELYRCAETGEELFTIRSFVPKVGAWEAWTIDNQDFQFENWTGPRDEHGAVLQADWSNSDASRRVVWTELADDFFEWELQEQKEGGWQPRQRYLGSRP